jgi:bifunctional oligoribonuclease and PAP phosphatase NrnA
VNRIRTTSRSRARPPITLSDIPAARREAIGRLAAEWTAGRLVVLSTHMNADGDGCGSQVALARLLAQRGVRCRIVNPTPWPELFRFLLGDDVEDATARGARAVRDADVLTVLDISDVSRLGTLADTVRKLKVPRLVVDHHVASDDPAGDIILADTEACATGELVYDIARVLELEITPDIAQGIYIALLTDTGGFRFSNTTPRCHAIAAEMLQAGVDPERTYIRVFASAPPGRVNLLAEVLATFEFDAEAGLSWLSMTAGALERHGVRAEDLDGITEHARAVAGTRMALFFRDLGHGKVKLSFRSTGDVDVNRFARRFGGGGHVKAAGAMVTGSLEEAQRTVVDAAREYLRTGGE